MGLASGPPAGYHGGMNLSHRSVVAAVALSVLCLVPTPARAGERLPAGAVERFADLALACVHQEYPNKIAHVMMADSDAQAPRTLTPAFYGCFDWHSAVHGHWLLARLARLYPDAAVRAARAGGAGDEPHAGEHRRRGALPGGPAARRRSSGRTGWPGCCSCDAELREWDDPQAREWAATLDAAGAAVRRAPDDVAAEADAAGADRRAQPDRLRARAGARLGADRGRHRQRGGLRDGRPALLPGGPRLPARLRALGRGLPLPLPGRGRRGPPRAAAGRVRALARRLPARPAARRAGRLAGARHRHRPDRRQADPPRTDSTSRAPG